MTSVASKLSIVRRFLAARYQQELGQTLVDSLEAPHAQPVWRWVKAANLRTPAPPEDPASAGALLDAELGLVLFVVPFAPQDDLAAQVAAALNLQSSLQPASPPSGPSDEAGPWQVALYWLVEASARSDWEDQMAELRQRPGCADELIFDAVFYSPDNLQQALEAHGLPRLMLTARLVLSKPAAADLANWMSADRAVLRELEDFAGEFTEPEQRRRAELIQDQLGEIVAALRATDGTAPAQARPLDSLEVRDFRNLQQVRLHFGLAACSCRVIHGPNGTGKSSLCEALSLALCGSSPRYRQFLDRAERNVTASNRPKLYAQRYLAPFHGAERPPKLALNGAELSAPALVESWEEASRLEHELDGTLLAQETSQELLQRSPEELAVRVLTGYSEYAEQLERFVAQRVAEATERRQAFLRELGLSASITKIETALERIARQLVQREWPGAPAAWLNWLEELASCSETAPDEGPSASNWRAWADEPARDELARHLTSSAEPDAVQAIAAWLEQGNSLIRQTRQWFDRLDARLAPLRDRLEDTLRDLEAWGAWLARRPGLPQGAGQTPSDLAALRCQLAELQAAQQRVLREGQSLRPHLEHLEKAATFLSQGWTALHPSRCPTCGADHAERGGIAQAVVRVREEVNAAREKLLREYREVEEKVKALQRRLQEQGDTPCPVSAERQATLREVLAWLLPATQATLEAQLAEPALRSRWLKRLRLLQARPALTSEVTQPRAEAERVVRAYLAQAEAARDAFFEPDHWKPVQAAFTQRLARVIAEHLPATLQRLWVELTLNLTPAPWLLPERPALHVVNQRGKRQVSVVVGEGLARYLLNQAETHLLGLGWFFARYLTHGRFRHAFLVMDDPAQQLDSASFRDLCRLWRALLRLHRVRRLPLRLAVFLHQEDRARDAARATDGVVDFLRWTPEQQGELRRLELRPATALPSHPDAWFGRQRAVA